MKFSTAFFCTLGLTASVLLGGCGGGETTTASSSNGAPPSSSPSPSPAPAPPGNYLLTISTSGVSTGTVTSTSHAGIDCGSDCSEPYPANTQVTLRAVASANYSFTGWSDACSSSGTNSTCTVTMSVARSATATFTANSPLPSPPPVIPPPSTSGGPVLFFTDLANAPRSGNSDTVPGQTAGDEDGAIVTLWGKNLGSAQGGSTLTVGGVPVRRIYYWGNATRGGGANLYARLGLQMIEFQVPRGAGGNGALTGSVAANILVTVNGSPSNPLVFSVRDAGRIYFVSPTGNDNNPGTYASPWRNFSRVVSTSPAGIGNGDVVYFMDGFAASATANVTGGGIFPLSTDGGATLPKALVAYPGATAIVGGSACETTGHGLIRNYAANGDFLTSHWVISKLRVVSPSSCAQNTAVEIGAGFRLIGNYLSTPRTSDGCQSGTVQCGGNGDCGNNIAILGNELTRAQTANWSTGSKQCHGFYISGHRYRDQVESNREIAWNYIHDNANNRAINIYNESSDLAHRRAFISGHRVHDNWIENQAGIGILLGQDIVGDNWLYNNVVVNAGLGPDLDHPNTPSKFSDDGGYTPLQLNFGSTWNSSSSAANAARDATVVHAYNNLIYGGSNPGVLAINPSMTYTVGLVTYSPVRPGTSYPLPALNFYNNIVVATLPDVPYQPPYSTAPAGRNNLWFGAQQLTPGTGRGEFATPAGEVSPVTSDPRFVDTAARNFHLRTTSPVSPARDAGATVPLSLDFDGVPRPQGGVFDIGPYEAQ